MNLYDVALFFRQLATLTHAGIPLIHALTSIEQTYSKLALRALVSNIKHSILSGKTLHQSILSHAQHFTPLTQQLIHIGEQTGKLESMLILIANYLESQLAFHAKIKKALFYPCFITISAAVITIGMFTFIVPRFADLLANFPQQLPLITRMIFSISHILCHSGWWLVIIFSLGIGSSLYPPWRLAVKKSCQPVILRLPLLRHLTQLIQLTQFSQQLSHAFTAGIPILTALQLIHRTCPYPAFAQHLIKLQYHVNNGWPLHHAMATLPYFPSLMTQMIRLGEESGKLDLMLMKIVDLYTIELDGWLHRCTQLLEPLIMLVLGVLIGGLVIGMYLPIFKLGSLF